MLSGFVWPTVSGFNISLCVVYPVCKTVKSQQSEWYKDETSWFWTEM